MQVRVPGSALLGRQNTGFYQLMEQLPQVLFISHLARILVKMFFLSKERLMIGVHSVATCEAVFEATRDWVY